MPPRSKPQAEAPPAAEPVAAPPLPFRVPFWVARVPLPVGAEMGSDGTARAFNPGDLVPDEHVQRYGWQAQVELPPGVAGPDGAVPDSDQAAEAGPDKE